MICAWDEKSFAIIEDDEDEKNQIVNIRGRDALDHYFLSLPRGYYLVDKEENAVFGYRNFTSGQTYFRRRRNAARREIVSPGSTGPICQ